MSSNFTLFTSDPGSQSSGNAFDQDAFIDLSLAADNNTGFSSTISSNPLGLNLANDDCPRLGPKTLYIKDLVLVEDHALWIQGKPTYRIVWNENFPAAQGYVFGNFSLVRGRFLSIRQAGDGIGITGVFRKCAFIVTAATAATGTAQLALDGANTTTVTLGAATFGALDGDQNLFKGNKYAAFVHASSNETRDIHDFRLTAIQTNTLNLVGVVVYAENSGRNIDLFPGITYNNKTRVATTAGATLALPSYSGNLGGRALIYKAQNGAYTLATQPAPNVQSVATGSSGTNLLNVTTGTGASFPLGSGIAAFYGATGYLGNVRSVSTDTLTVSPTLPFGVSGLIYKTYSAGQSLAIASSQMAFAQSIDFNKILGFTNYYADPQGQYQIWGSGIGFTLVDGQWNSLLGQNVTTGFLQVDGYFSAADIEFVGQGVLHATFNVNGLPAFGLNAGQTGCIKKTIFTDAGPGWNSVNFTFGISYSGIGINRINLFQRALPQGLSYGLLSSLDTLSSPVPGGAVNATLLTQGIYRRHFADQLYFVGPWVRSAVSTAAGGIAYAGSTTNCSLNFQYYGKNFAVLGINAGQSLALALDGGAAAGFNFNTMQSVATEGFHSVAITNGTGSTALVHAIDVMRTQGELTNLQRTTPLNLPPMSCQDSSLKLVTGLNYGTTFTFVRRYLKAFSSGSDHTYIDDVGYGGVVRINRKSVWDINATENAVGVAGFFAITSNAVIGQGVSGAVILLGSESPSILSAWQTPASAPTIGHACVAFDAGDMVRFHGDATPDDSAGDARVVMTKVRDL